MGTQTSALHDTQPVSPSYFASIIISRRSTNALDGHVGDDAEDTQMTREEGHEGHIDLLSSFAPVDGADTQGRDTQGQDEDASDAEVASPSQPDVQLPIFPESQRFKTPATVSRKRYANGEMVESPLLPRNPFANNGPANEGKIMGLSQVFAGTQAASSPFMSDLPPQLPSDRPSPNIALQTRPATVSTSSPLLERHRIVGEPVAQYRTVDQSQDDRHRRAVSEGGEPGLSAESSDDDFDNEPSIVRRRRQAKERDDIARMQFNAISSPVRQPRTSDDTARKSTGRTRSFASPNRSRSMNAKFRMPHDSPSEVEHRPAAAFDEANESEQDTDVEANKDVAVRQSSQLDPNDDEDKENMPFDLRRIPDTVKTTARLQQVLDGDHDLETSPIFTHVYGNVQKKADELVGGTEERPAVLNSQPSQPLARALFEAKQKLFSSGQSADFIPQSPPAVEPLEPSSQPPDETGLSRQTIDMLPSHQMSAAATTTTSHDVSENNESHVATVRKEGTKQESNVNTATDRSQPLAQFEPVTPMDVDATTSGGPKTQGLPASTNDATYETAPSHVSQASPSARQLCTKSAPEPVKTPQTRKRRMMTEIAADPSPQRSSSGYLGEMLATMQDLEAKEILSSQSPIRPRRASKRQRLTGPNLQPPATNISQPPNEIISIGSGVMRRDMSSHANSRSVPFEENMPPPQPLGEVKQQPVGHHKRKKQSSSTQEPSSNRQGRVPERPTRSKRSMFDIEAIPPAPTASEPCDHGKHVWSLGVEQTRPKDETPKGKTDAPAKPNRKSPKIAKKSKETVDPVAECETNTVADGEAPTMVSNHCDGSGPSLFPNQVWACFNGKTRAYYPATCLGLSGADSLKYIVQWEGYDPDEVDAYGVRTLDLRVGDIVKVDQKGFPKYAHVVKGFKDQVQLGDDNHVFTDIRGFQTLVVVPKQRESLPGDVDLGNVKEVPISSIYLDKNMWHQMKDRVYEASSLQAPVQQSGITTPMERPSTPSTPSSRTRRLQATTSTALAVTIAESSGLLSNMVFAISYDESAQKSQLTYQILAQGGTILNEGFQEFFESDTDSFTLKPIHANTTTFCALIADRHSRKEKYMQALALGLPCLSGKWIESCISAHQIQNWTTYLLPAGESALLGGATRSRTFPPACFADSTKLSSTISYRPTFLTDQSVVVVTGKGKADEKKRASYFFLIRTLQPKTIERAPDVKSALKTVETRKEMVDWLFVDDREVEGARTALMEMKVVSPGPKASGSLRGRKGTSSTSGGRKSIAESSVDRGPGVDVKVKVVGNEFIVQSLILGQVWEDGIA